MHDDQGGFDSFATVRGEMGDIKAGLPSAKRHLLAETLNLRLTAPLNCGSSLEAVSLLSTGSGKSRESRIIRKQVLPGRTPRTPYTAI